MTIELKIKDGMSEKALNILQDLKGIFFEKIEIKDKEFLKKQKELQDILDRVIDNPESLMNHDEVWSRLDNK